MSGELSPASVFYELQRALGQETVAQVDLRLVSRTLSCGSTPLLPLPSRAVAALNSAFAPRLQASQKRHSSYDMEPFPRMRPMAWGSQILK